MAYSPSTPPPQPNPVPPPKPKYNPGAPKPGVNRMPHVHREYSYTQHEFVPKTSEDYKVRSKGPQVTYGNYNLINRNAAYQPSDKGTAEYWQSMNIGYEEPPTYWEDPRHVAAAHNLLKSLQPGEPPPEWIDPKYVEDAYKYLSYANGTENWVNWKYLAPNDPGRKFLQSIPLPPVEYVMQPDQYQALKFNEVVWQKPEERDPVVVAGLNQSYKYALEQHDAQVKQAEWNTAHTPGWQRTMEGIMSNPITGGLFQTVPLAVPALLSGNPLAMAGGVAMVGSGLGVGYSQQIRDTHPYLADAIAGASVLLPWGMAIGTAVNPGVGTAVGGAIGLGVGGAAGWLYGQTGMGDYLADKYGWETLRGNRAADAAMALLDAPAEMVERILGVSIQLDLAKEHPEIYGTPEDIWQNLPAAWQAGSMAWESGAIWKMITQADHQVALGAADTLGGTTANKNSYILRRLGQNPFNVIPLLNEVAIRSGLMKGNLEDIKYIDPSQTFIFGYPYPVELDSTGAAAMTEARRLIEAGADPYKTLMDYKASFGIPGNTAELAGHMIVDPLNRWGEITKYAASGIADIAGQPNLAKSLRLESSGGIFEGLKAHSELVKKFYPMDQLTAWDLKYAGWNADTQGFKIVPANTSANPLARVFDFNKTPQTQVMDNIKNTWDFLGSLLSPFRRNGDIDGMVNVFHRAGGNPDSAKESASSSLLGTLTGVAASKTMESFAPKADELGIEYHSYDMQRTLKDRLVGALDTSSAELVKRIEISENEAELIRSLYGELDAVVRNPDATPEQKALAKDLLVDLNPGEGKLPIVGAEQLKQIADAFGKGSEVPKTPDEFLGKLVSAYTEYSSKVLSDALGVTARPWMMQLTGALKALQSAALLNLNVGYVVPHAVLNPLTILASGAGGLVSIKSSLAPDIMRSWWKNFGFEPYRTHAGSGMGGSADVELLGRKGTAAAEKNLRKATQAKGLMADIERIAQKFSKSFAVMPFAAEKMERFQSEVAMYAFTKKTWDALIRHNRAYTPLEATLRSSLDAVDPTIVNRIDNAIRNNMDVDSVMKEVFGDELRVDLSGALDELSTKFGTDARIISETLDQYPGLKERLADIRRIEDVDPLFTEIYQRIEATNRERLGREVGAKVKEIMTRVGASGQSEAQRVVDQKLQVVEENYMRHMMLMIEAHAQADAIKAQGGDVRAFWNATRAESARFFATAEANDYAILRGMLEGMDLSKPGSQKYMQDVVKQYEAWQKHYRLIGDTWNEYYRNYDSYATPQDRQLAISEVYARLDENYAQVVSEVANRQTMMDNDFVEMVRLKYGDDTATVAKKWRDSINTFTQDRAKLIQAERDKIRKIINIDEVRAEWKRFTEQELAPLVRDYHNLDHAGVSELNGVLTGMQLPEKPVSAKVETAPKTKTAEVKPAEEVAPEVTRTQVEDAEDAGYMLQALDYIDQPGKSGVLIPDGEGGFVRESSGYPDWYATYGFSNSKYLGDSGLKALRKALDYFVNHNGQPDLTATGKPYAIFEKIQECILKEGSKRLIETAMENPEAVLADRAERLAYLDGVKKTVDRVTNRSEIGNRPTNLPETTDESRPMTPEELADSEPFKDYPATLVEDMTSQPSIAEMSSDAWYDAVLPMIHQLQDTIKQRGLVGKGTPLPSDLHQKVSRYINNTIAGDYATAKAASVGYGTAMRDYSLVNYSDQRGIDNWLSAIIPYQFWATRSAMNWLMRAWDHPAWFANYYRMRKFMQSAQTQSGFPARLRDTMSIPAAYLPEWAGGNLYFDPLQNIFPFDQFYNGVEMLTQNFNQQEKDAMTVLYGWKNQGTINQAELTEAVQTKTGDIWNRAMGQAKVDENAGKYNPFEFLQMFLGPALYLTYPYFLLTGQKEKISPLPGTRMGQAIQAATADSPLQSIGKFIGGAIAYPETAFRKAIGISEFGEWGDYYIDRQMANMVGDGTFTLPEVEQAMIEHTGPVYEEARKRVMLEISARVPGAIPTYAALHGAWQDPSQMSSAMLFGLYPASILPEGEMIARGLYDEYKAVGQNYQNGDRKAYDRFFEDHPEYQARLALFDKPEERLRQLLISEVWDKYGAMGQTEKYEFRDAIGDDFNNYFLNDQTRNYSQVDTETLAGWAKIMGAYVPQTEQTQPVIDDPDINVGMLQSATPEVYAEVDAYRQIRSSQFPNYNALGQRYFSLPPGAQRKAFLAQFPELADYWDWSKAYKAQHPNVELYIKAPTGPEQPQYDYSFVTEITKPLERQIYAYYYSDKPLSEGANAELHRIWRNSNIGGDYQDFLDIVLRTLFPPTIQ